MLFRSPFDADAYFGGDVALTPAGRQYGLNVGTPVGKGYIGAYGNYMPSQKDLEIGAQYSTPFADGGPVISPMGDTFISQPDQDYSQAPGYATVADVQDAIAKVAGSRVGRLALKIINLSSKGPGSGPLKVRPKRSLI